MLHRLGIRSVYKDGGSKATTLPAPSRADRDIREDYQEVFQKIEKNDEVVIYFEDNGEQIIIKPLEVPHP